MKPLQTLKHGVLALLLLSLTLPAYSQKLNDIQKGGVWAPANVRIDAKLNEWDDSFQAYNNTINVFYTMSNDDKNLYLVMKTNDQMNTNKVMAGGINFTINTTGKKKEKDAYTVVFPLINMPRPGSQPGSVVVMRSPTGGDNIRIAVGGPPGGPMPGPPDSATIAARRKRQISMVKEIKLLGFVADIPDTVISLYNEYSIKAAVDYDTKGNLVYEMAIPLKYLHLSTEGFAYNIKLNGLDLSGMIPPGASASGGGRDSVRIGTPPPGMMMSMQSMTSPTDFWGKYTLAKKQ